MLESNYQQTKPQACLTLLLALCLLISFTNGYTRKYLSKSDYHSGSSNLNIPKTATHAITTESPVKVLAPEPTLEEIPVFLDKDGFSIPHYPRNILKSLTYMQQYPMAFHQYLHSEDYQTVFHKSMLEKVSTFVAQQQAKSRTKSPREDEQLKKLLFLIGRSLFSSKEFAEKAMMEDELDLEQAKYELNKLTGLSYYPSRTADLSRSYLDDTKFYACKIKASNNKADYKKLHFYIGALLNCPDRGGIKIFDLWNLETYTEIVPVQYKDEIWVIIGSGTKKFKVVTSAIEKYKGKYGIQYKRTVTKPAKATWDALDQGHFKRNSDRNRALAKYGLWVRE